MVARKFRYLPHTADIAFIAYGKTFNSAFENAAEALLNIMLDLKAIGRENSRILSVSINESADSLEDLAWYVLQDIITKVDSRKLSAYGFHVEKFEKKQRLKISGKLLYKKSARDLFLLEVKAVTPHELKVKKSRSGYTIQILVDV